MAGKPIKVSRLEHRLSGVKADVLFCRSTKAFYVNIMGHQVGAESEKECVRKAHEYCDSLVNLEWKKVIIINTRVKEYFNDADDAVCLRYRIDVIARKLGGGYLHVGSGTVPVEEYAYFASSYHDPVESRPEKGEYILPYSEELVMALDKIMLGIKVLRSSLDALMASSDSARIIETATKSAWAALTDGKSESEEVTP
ncbi:MAG: hypothetical protein WC505_07105 [Patescibacteria group bacterium]